MNTLYNEISERKQEKRYSAAKAKTETAARILWKIFRGLLLVGISFIILYPIIYMTSVAFRPLEQIYDPSVVWVPKSLTLENFAEAYRLMEYPKALFTSVIINVVSSLLQVAICAVTGYGFARFNFKFKKLFFALVLITVLVPPSIIVNPSYLNFKSFDFFGLGSLAGLFTGSPFTVNLLDTPLTFYLPSILGAGLKSGLFIFIFRQFFRGLPKELEDAAVIDGCGFVMCFLRVIIPNALTVGLTAIILSVVWYWNDYFISSIYMINLQTVTVALVNLQSSAFNETIINDPFRTITLMQAGSLLAILPVLLMYILLQKYFIQGVERSGIVG